LHLGLTPTGTYACPSQLHLTLNFHKKNISYHHYHSTSKSKDNLLTLPCLRMRRHQQLVGMLDKLLTIGHGRSTRCSQPMSKSLVAVGPKLPLVVRRG